VKRFLRWYWTRRFTRTAALFIQTQQAAKAVHEANDIADRRWSYSPYVEAAKLRGLRERARVEMLHAAERIDALNTKKEPAPVESP
jgi:hypothetical protein